MDGRKSLALLGISGGALVLGILAACAQPVQDTSAKGSVSAVIQRPFDRNNVLDDKSMLDANAMTVADVQKFLDKTPWGTKSALASYTEGGKTAATIMVETAKAHGINPLEMLVRVQMEQGLLSKTTAPTTTIAIAFGCGCPHSPVCSDAYRGFANQAECAAGTLRRSMDRAVTSTGTVSGWARNKSKDTEDGLTIIPKNAVTAALYTYTPYVGEAGGGKAGIGGVSLHAQVWNRFAEAANYGEWAAQGAGGNASADDDAGSANPDPNASNQDPNPDDSDGSSPDPTPSGDADSGARADSGPMGESSDPESGSKGAPDNGKDDGAILGNGNAPPSSNAPPPSSKTRTPTKPEELPMASEADLAGKDKSTGGCSTTGNRGTTSAWLVGLALALVASRRRNA
jgi:uncharacterized protein (TIGR03382 family)